ncbi:hypothetical protein ASPSYDRAFT_95226 [Aspergillus sydowii CBS 593.65]|uniref:Uncharacterized protein n=1 Tax=Aspergillus sydowii CBS 593.65 TaxID=1036612 RepID=A0A1L9T093_9EURO|nr:uncharacterized protein ASPSYDRAFT_95226 [Aspergillus sydowii CBS 593.65]OJJ52860.1 hypothetical protein ASPSYDRAFT_95226 [Aspergillus sydowii CBS 593.65]
MKFSVVTALATLAALTSAFDVSVTFYGENNEDSYSLLVPTDRTPVQIDNPLVVHRVTSPGGGFCTFVGVDGESVVIYAEDEKFLETPQAMKWGSCGNN